MMWLLIILTMGSYTPGWTPWNGVSEVIECHSPDLCDKAARAITKAHCRAAGVELMEDQEYLARYEVNRGYWCGDRDNIWAGDYLFRVLIKQVVE